MFPNVMDVARHNSQCDEALTSRNAVIKAFVEIILF
jgi:hypothetical protein